MRVELNIGCIYIKFCDGDGPNICRVKKLVVHLLKIYFGLS